LGMGPSRDLARLAASGRFHLLLVFGAYLLPPKKALNGYLI
jgi:hypothetical protein